MFFELVPLIMTSDPACHFFLNYSLCNMTVFMTIMDIFLFQLEVKDPQQKRVKLGSLTLGQKVNKQLVLINRSLLDISFTLALKTNTPLDSKVMKQTRQH